MTTFTIEEAARSFDKMAQLALTGETVLLVGDGGELVLKSASLSEDGVPVRPDGYFDDAYDKTEAEESNRIAARGPRKVVR